MAFLSPENVQRSKLVRFDLEPVIRAPANTQEKQKEGINSQLNIDVIFLVVITIFSNLNSK